METIVGCFLFLIYALVLSTIGYMLPRFSDVLVIGLLLFVVWLFFNGA